MSIIDFKLDVPYEKANLSYEGCNPTLRAYLVDVSPEIGLRNRPAIVICPGGGYEFLSDREADYVAMRYCAYGIHAFVLRYSICDKKYPTALLEAACAVKLVREHAQEWDINPDNINICGFSAGGHLAASLAVNWHKDYVTDAIGSKDLHKPNGAVLSYPVITSGKYAHGGSIRNIIGENPTEEALTMVSCEKQISEFTPPVFIWHCADDGCVPVMNTIDFTKALSEHNVPFECHIYPWGGHGGSLHDDVTSGYDGHINPVNAKWFEASVRWIKSK